MVTYDPNTGEYRDGATGAVVPRVSWILQALDIYGEIREDVLARAAARGTAVHESCQLWDENDLDEESLDPRIAPYLDGWKSFRKDTGFEPEHIEVAIHNSPYNYAGRIDRIGKVSSGKTFLVDIKTGSGDYGNGKKGRVAGMQMAAYSAAWGDNTIDSRIIVQLQPTGKYKIYQKDDRSFWNDFKICLYFYKLKESMKNDR